MRFLREGPGNETGESCPEDDLPTCAETDTAGEASFDFTGSSAGTAHVTALIYDAAGERLAVAEDTVVFGFVVVCRSARTTCPNASKLSSRSEAGLDVLMVNSRAKTGGARVRLQRKESEGWKQVGRAATLNSRGDHTFTVMDRNRHRRTVYRARVAATIDTRADTTNVVRQR